MDQEPPLSNKNFQISQVPENKKIMKIRHTLHATNGQHVLDMATDKKCKQMI
jgi:hypothetical protein